jgi:hypothetical protein
VTVPGSYCRKKGLWIFPPVVAVSTMLSALLAAGALGVAAVGVASSANAKPATIGSQGDHDPYNYRDELWYTGLHHEEATNAQSLASRVCGKRAMGYNEDQLVSGLIGPDPLYTTEQAIEIVLGGEYHFCPPYEDDGSIGARGYTGPPETM